MTKDRQEQERQHDLDARLTAYYGPILPEQPLSSKAWITLRQQLRQQQSGRIERHRWHGVRGLCRTMTRKATLPSFVQESLGRVMHEARWSQHSPPIYCTVQSKVRDPSLHMNSILLVGRPTMRVILPIDAPITMQNIEIDVLLASGLARSLLMNRVANCIVRYTLACLLLLECFTVIYGVLHKQFYQLIPIAIVVAIGTIVLWKYQQRRHVFMADMMIVNWLGRSRVCEGLHGLARRSQRPRRWQWREPSLEARIKRVCGTKVASKDRDLTLVG